MSGPIVLTRAIQVHRALIDAEIDNAIGGALALAYHVDDPRATQDIDIDVALPATRASEALRCLPDELEWDDDTLGQIARDEQVRLLWPVPAQVAMPLDLFFSADQLHVELFGRTVEVPMLDTTVKVLSATDLTIFKALFNRPKDWPDIIAMIEAHDSTVDLAAAVRVVARIVGSDDQRVTRLVELMTR